MVTTVTKAINAYNNALKNSANIKSQNDANQAAPKFTTVRPTDGATALNNAPMRIAAEMPAASTFPQVVSQIMQDHMHKIRQGETAARKTVKDERTDLIEVMAAINESESALYTIVTIRDRLVAAYQDVMKMPI